MKHLDTMVVTSIFVGVGLVELAAGKYINSRRRKDDWIIDLVSIFQLAVLIKPAIILATGFAMAALLPGYAGALSHWPLWAAVLIIVLPDEFLHYWYHRKGHEWTWLWKIHRTHHTAPELGVGVSYRENWLWFVLMPNLWYSASMIHFGLGEAYIISNMMIGIVDIITHTTVRWDAILYRHPVLRPVAWVVERVITLPSTHHAHHGVGAHSAPMGNYATLIFFWDVLFRTANFPRNYPETYGLKQDPKDPWYAQLWWPVLKSDKPGSEIA